MKGSSTVRLAASWCMRVVEQQSQSEFFFQLAMVRLAMRLTRDKPSDFTRLLAYAYNDTAFHFN